MMRHMKHRLAKLEASAAPPAHLKPFRIVLLQEGESPPDDFDPENGFALEFIDPDPAMIADDWTPNTEVSGAADTRDAEHPVDHSGWPINAADAAGEPT